MSNLVRYEGGKGHVPVIRRGDGGLRRISFDVLFLNKGMAYREKTGSNEVCLVVLGGRCTVEADGKTWKNIGKRKDVFDGRAAAVYVPAGSDLRVVAGRGPVEVAVCRVKADRKTKAAYIPPEKVKVVSRGRDNWSRTVHDIVDQDVDASNMLVGETFSPPGNWSSAPPHRHDVDDPPRETNHEEIYFFKVKPAQGFMVIRLYTDDRSLDETYTVENNDTVIIPEGYHPVASGPGYEGYYLWILAGRERTVCTHDDPRHAWLKKEKPKSGKGGARRK